MIKIDAVSRQELAKTVWNMFISNVVKAKVHYGRKHVMIVLELDDVVDSEDVIEANLMNHNVYQELKNVPMPKSS